MDESMTINWWNAVCVYVGSAAKPRSGRVVIQIPSPRKEKTLKITVSPPYGHSSISYASERGWDIYHGLVHTGANVGIFDYSKGLAQRSWRDKEPVPLSKEPHNE